MSRSTGLYDFFSRSQRERFTLFSLRLVAKATVTGPLASEVRHTRTNPVAAP